MRGVHSVAIAVLLTVISAAAQSVLNSPGKIADAEKRLQNFHGEPLNCSVISTKPELKFSLRMQTGYVYRVPFNQYRGAGHSWIVLTRVTPQEGSLQPTYFADVAPLPEIPTTNAEGDVRGSWWVGEGRYRVKSLLFDDSGRGCLKEWQIDARLSGAGRKLEPLLSPNTVAGMRWSGSPPVERASSGGLSRLTVLLDSVALPGRSVLTGFDRGLLLDALSALVEELPARAVRLVVFHLDLQKEVFRREGFTLDAISEVARAMKEIRPTVVDYSVLQHQGGELELIANLANSEMRSSNPSDAVIFMGSTARNLGKIPVGVLDQPRGPSPQFFYLQCVPRPNFRVDGETPETPLVWSSTDGSRVARPMVISPANRLPDSIAEAIARLKGRTMAAGSPEEFAKAIAEVRRSLASKIP